MDALRLLEDGAALGDGFVSFASALALGAFLGLSGGGRIMSTIHGGIVGMLPSLCASISGNESSAVRHIEPSGQTAPGATIQPEWPPLTLMPRPASLPSLLPSRLPSGGCWKMK